MAAGLPPELHEIIERSHNAAKELQVHINSFNGSVALNTELFSSLIQAHTAHLLNHSTIIRHITSAFASDALDPALQNVVNAGEQMITDTRQLQEYIIGLQVRKNRGANRPTTAAPTPKAYRAPTAEAEEDEVQGGATATNGGNIPPQPQGRKSKAHWTEKKDTSTRIPTEEADVLRSSPKRQLAESDDLPTQAMVKRTKLSPIPAIRNPKRKSDVSMVDAEEEEVDNPSATSPSGKRHKTNHPETEQHVPQVAIEYDDITAEVNARMKQREDRKKRELGIIDKRKRQSNDSFEVEIGQLQDREAAQAEIEKRERKRKKKRHSGYVDD